MIVMNLERVLCVLAVLCLYAVERCVCVLVKRKEARAGVAKLQDEVARAGYGRLRACAVRTRVYRGCSLSDVIEQQHRPTDRKNTASTTR